MRDFHGIIFAYGAANELGELVRSRTAASLPVCGRYRLIDFALSALRNAGVLDVGVVMQRDYQSLLDHMGSGKAWDMSRREGGLRMLPPFGLPEYHTGKYTGTIEALNAVSEYIHAIPQKNIVLLLGNVCANVDLSAAMAQHLRSGAEATAICADHPIVGLHHRYVQGEDGLVSKLLFDREDGEGGIASLEGYIISKDALISLMNRCRERNLYGFHRDAMAMFLADGGKMDIFVHRGYAAAVNTVEAYYTANMDMLRTENRRDLFPPSRPVRTRNIEGVSTYYGEHARSHNCLVADNCFIEGDIENCIIFSGARIAKGAMLRDSIIMRGCTIGAGVELNCVIADKNVTVSSGQTLRGSPRLPMVIPKNTQI